METVWAGAPSTNASDRLQWTHEFALLTNRFVLWDLAKLLAWMGAIVALVSGVIAAATAPDEFLAQWRLLGGAFAVGTAVLVALVVLVMAVVFGNRYRATFEVTPEGIAFSGGVRRDGRATGEHRFMRWTDIRRLRVHRAQHTISVMNGWRVVFRLYCTSARFAEVERFVRAHAAPGAIIDATTPGDVSANGAC